MIEGEGSALSRPKQAGHSGAVASHSGRPKSRDRTVDPGGAWNWVPSESVMEKFFPDMAPGTVPRVFA